MADGEDRRFGELPLPQTIAANSPIQNASTSQSTIAAALKMRQKKNSCGA